MIPQVKLPIGLHSKQQEIENSPARFKVIDTGKRFGKSKWACYSLVRHAGLCPGGVFWYIAPTYGQAQDIAWSELISLIPPHLIQSKSKEKLTIQLTNRATITLKGADNEDTLRGVALDGVIFDERSYMDEGIWPRIIRGQLVKSKGFAYFISSPNRKGRNHWTNFCEMAKAKMEAGDPDWFYRHFTIWDNPHLDRKEIQDMKDGMPDDIWNLEYMAETSAIAGQLFSEFNYGLHAMEMDVEKFPIQILGLDYGYDHPCANLWLNIDPAKRLIYVSDELVKSGMQLHELCNTVVLKSENRIPDYGVIDPSAVKGSSLKDMNKTIVHDYMQEFHANPRWENFNIQLGDRGNRGYSIVKMYLKKNMLYVNPKCKALIYELNNLQYGDKTGDDATDALRYACVMIHDRMEGMKIFDESKTVDYKKNAGQISLYDPMFTNSKKEVSNEWIFSEVA